MFELTRINAQTEAGTQGPGSIASQSSTKRPSRGSLLDICIVLAMGALLFYGASWQIFRVYTDAAKYQCYAVAFWQGTQALHTLPSDQCTFIGASSSASIIHRMQSYGFPPFLISMVEAQD